METDSIIGFVFFVAIVAFMWRGFSKSRSEERKAIEKIYEKLRELKSCELIWKYTFGYFPDDPYVLGSLKGYKFKVWLSYDEGALDNYVIELNGNFPKQKGMEWFLGTNTGRDVKWHGNRIRKEISLGCSVEILEHLDELVVFATELDSSIV